LVVDRTARAFRRAFDRRSQPTRLVYGVLFGVAIPLAVVMACSDEPVKAPIVSGGGLAGGPGAPDPCATPSEGCACENEGAEVDCGRIREQFDDYVTCQMGTRTCTDGAWSACNGDRITVKSTATGSPGLGTRALGSAQACPKDAGPDLDPCDPYCNVTPDTPGDFDAGATFSNTDAGLTLIATADGGVPCSTLSVVPRPTTVTAGDVVTVSDFGPPPVTSPEGPVRFDVTYGPMGCATPSPFPATWTIDRVDRAQISGTNNTNGQLTIAVPIAGPIVVTLYALGTSASTTVNVKVNVVEAPTTDADATPNHTPVSWTSINAFSTVPNACAPTVTDACRNSPNVPATASTATWLYPYADTYLPLGLPAPWVQYMFAASSSPDAVKVSLRYPTGLGATSAGTLFNYSLIVEETNSVARVFAGLSETTLDPQVIIAQLAWQYFEQTARGQDADLIVQRRTGAGVLETENRRQIHFVDGQLKGTVYYSTYNSKLPGAENTGAILKIAPGATTPTLAVQPSQRCTVCHSVNLNGTRLITNTGAGPTGNVFNESRRYDLTTAGPSPSIENSYPGADGPIPPVGGETTVTRNGAGPNITISGTATDDGYARLTVTTGGARGTARFNWDYGGLTATLVGTNVLTATTVGMTGTGLTINFPTGTYVAGTTYEFRASNTAGNYSGEYYAHVLGNRYTFGAPWMAGDFYMTHGGRATGTTGVGDPNFRAPPDYSGLYAVDPDSARTQPIAVANWPANMLAVTPRFSPDGTKIAFGFWGGSPLPTSSMATTLAQVTAGSRLAVMDFSLTCSSPPCTSNAEAGLAVAVSNARDLTPGVRQRVAWPTFTPAGDAVVYQRQYRTSKSRTENPVLVPSIGTSPNVTLSGQPAFIAPNSDDTGTIVINVAGTRGGARFNWTYGGMSGTNVLTAASVALGTTGITANFPTGTYPLTTTYTFSGSHLGTIGDPGWGQWTGWSPSHVNTSAGALAELWISAVPADGNTPAVPTQLSALNGLLGGSSYLPTASRLATPAQNTYHATNASFAITQADLCSNTGTAQGVNDHQLNYLPSFNPTQVGGYNWVIFTSRRMFGNVAYSNPWDADSELTCDTGVPPTKKLWVAAIDPNVTPGTDPSHPAFYLPGQELRAGNADGYWVNSPCGVLNSACVTNDDCCFATGPSPTRECKVTSSATVPPTKLCQSIASCSPSGAACATTADCCSGLTCPAGGGVCIVEPPPPVTIYNPQTTSREYIADCPHGTQPKWRFFEWQATVPMGTSIVFSIQVRPDASTSYAPPMPVILSTATPASGTGPGIWYRGPQTVEQALAAVMPPLASGDYLRVTMTFNPTMTEAPTLHQWRQIFDCMPAE
jgi:hypothetical protein